MMFRMKINDSFHSNLFPLVIGVFETYETHLLGFREAKHVKQVTNGLMGVKMLHRSR